MHALRNRIAKRVAALVACLVLVLFIIFAVHTWMADSEWWYEFQQERAYEAHPSAALAYADGESHFDS